MFIRILIGINKGLTLYATIGKYDIANVKYGGNLYVYAKSEYDVVDVYGKRL